MRTTTATILLLAFAIPASAETDYDRAEMIRTRDLTGAEVYTTNTDGSMTWDADQTFDKVDGDWDNIGEIEDVVLDRNGQMIGVIAEVGGFLDIGDKHVFIEIDGVKLVPVDDRNFSLVTGLSKDQLMERKDLDEGFWD